MNRAVWDPCFKDLSISTRGEVQTPMTLIERLEAITHGMRPLELAALLGVGRSTCVRRQRFIRVSDNYFSLSTNDIYHHQ